MSKVREISSDISCSQVDLPPVRIWGLVGIFRRDFRLRLCQASTKFVELESDLACASKFVEKVRSLISDKFGLK